MIELKIGMICPFFSPHHGGTEKYVYNLGKIFSESHEVSVITTGQDTDIPSIERNKNFEILRFRARFKPLNNPISFSQLRYIISNHERFDILHFNDIYAFSTYSSLFVKKTPKLLTFHTWQIKYHSPLKNMILYGFENAAFNRIIGNMDGMIALVDSQKEYLEKIGVSPEKIYVIPNGVQVDFFGRDKDKARKYFNIGSDFVFGFFGRLVERKGIRLLLDVFSGSGSDLYIFGNGPLKPLIIQYSRKYRNIHFIEGPFSDDEVALIYSAIDLYILPSLSGEGCPTGLLEALSSGTMCLASDLQENVCTLRDKGLYFRTGDLKDLREKIEKSRYEKKDKNDLKNYAKEFDWKNISKKIMSIYNEII